MIIRFQSALRLVCALLVMTTLIACGAEETPSAPANSEAAATPTEAATQTDSAPAGATSRSIESRYGPIEVPTTPQRVVVLDEGALDTALAVGIQPVGAITSRGTNGVAPYIADKATGIAIVGTPAETNFEAVVTAQPDLILAPNRLDEEQYAKLSAIAPTFVPTNGISAWVDATREYADALGRTSEAEAILTQIDTQITGLREQLTKNAGASAVVVRWQPQGPMVMSRFLSSVLLLEQLGLTSPTIVTEIKDKPHTDVLSLENLAQIDTEWMFVATFNAEAEQALSAVQQEPAFQQLRAAKNNHVIAVNGQLWSSAYGPLATQAILNDIEKGMLDASGASK